MLPWRRGVDQACVLFQPLARTLASAAASSGSPATSACAAAIRMDQPSPLVHGRWSRRGCRPWSAAAPSPSPHETQCRPSAAAGNPAVEPLAVAEAHDHLHRPRWRGATDRAHSPAIRQPIRQHRAARRAPAPRPVPVGPCRRRAQAPAPLRLLRSTAPKPACERYTDAPAGRRRARGSWPREYLVLAPAPPRRNVLRPSPQRRWRATSAIHQAADTPSRLVVAGPAPRPGQACGGQGGATAISAGIVSVPSMLAPAGSGMGPQ